MPFSAKRSAYRPSPIFSSHSTIGCMAALDRLYPFSFLGPAKKHNAIMPGLGRGAGTYTERDGDPHHRRGAEVPQAARLCICSAVFLRRDRDELVLSSVLQSVARIW